MKNLVALLLFSFLLFSCINEDIDFRENNPKIEICIVKENQIERNQTDIDLESLKVEKEPWIKSSDIIFYDWSSHMFYLNKEKERGKYSGKYFLIKADLNPIFLGFFMHPASSSMSYFPSIIAWDNFLSSNDIVEIGGFGYFYQGQMESNENFKEALISADLFRQGIDVEMLKIERKNSSTLEYTFKVTNYDLDNIYVLDPNKMGVGRFHYYTNGVAVRKNEVSYYSEIESIASEEIRTSWYYKLAPQKSMTRTVTLNGFSDLPTGNVHFYFSFPGSKVEKGEWKKPDGRIWLGHKYIEGDLLIQ